ncbi:MAG TPA: hypothetical protein VEK07_01530 [Polyangiaceae bacterium]|nr:hypothetical protein [Polyangiaceae bacterium]
MILLRYLLVAAFVTVAVAACYSGGGGSPPPPDQLYYPVGLAVSNGGNVLYVVNSDFDLQWNGGTLQSYDLFLLRHDADALINANLLPPSEDPVALPCSSGVTANCIAVPFLGNWAPFGEAGSCLNTTPSTNTTESSNGSRIPLNEACSPAVNSQRYVRDNVNIGAFATELKLSPDGSRLFAPVRGNASLTWADVQPDGPPPGYPPGVTNAVPPADMTVANTNYATPWQQNVVPTDLSSDPFALQCFVDDSGQCTTTAGNFVDPLDSRELTLPGEPFAFALTPDGTAVAMTHQTSTNASLLLTGCYPLVPPLDGGLEGDGAALQGDGGGDTPPSSASELPDGGLEGDGATLEGDGGAGPALPPNACHPPAPAPVISSAISPLAPSMQFVLSGVANGGDGIAAIPHDDDPDSPAVGCEYTMPLPYMTVPPCVRPAFLETNHTTAAIDLIRYVNDDGSSVNRPYLFTDTIYTLTSNETGVDQRGIAIDPTPRLACRARATSPSESAACGLVPSRVFIASRAPASLILGQIGGLSLSGDGSFNPDLLTITGNVPLPPGPSNVYLAPIVNEAGNYELRVFVVCFDSNEVAVYNPDTGQVDLIDVGQNNGPFAMAFDPFDLTNVAQNAPVPRDLRQLDPSLKTYRFAYVANFTYSFVQLIDLDNSMSQISPQTFEQIVFTLGQPTAPKGS